MISTVCAACVHFWVIQATADYSECSPGNEFQMTCQKGHWDFDAQTITATGLAQIMAAGPDCPDFQARAPAEV